MGSPDNEAGRREQEGPQHEVTLTTGFWMAETPCTQALYEAVTGENPSYYQGGDRPVDNVTWNDACTFLSKLNERIPGLDVSLPTEAQWEYACRAGSTESTYAGSLTLDEDGGEAPELDAIAWYYRNSSDGTKPVAQKAQNAWGLYDTLGNVDEWCSDWFGAYSNEPQQDPTGPGTGVKRVIRGGSWFGLARSCRAAGRLAARPSFRDGYLGFRFVRGQEAAEAGPEGSTEIAESQERRDGRSPSGAVPDRRNRDADAPAVITRRNTSRTPEWADQAGFDRMGTYADVAISPKRRAADDVVIRFRLIPAGEFLMGSPPDEVGRDEDEGPQHVVRLSNGFWMADTPCTQDLYEAVVGSNPSRFKAATRPVEKVSWTDAQEFLEALNRKRGLKLTLPTEAQWEYACRAGTTAPTYGPIGEIAWYTENSGGETHPVREKQPNPWGLYDMLGNVYEWCDDRAYRKYSGEGQRDPVGPEVGGERVFRGGSWFVSARDCRAAIRHAFRPSYRHGYLGFRFVRGQEAAEAGPEGPRLGRSPRPKTAERSTPIAPTSSSRPIEPSSRSA